MTPGGSPSPLDTQANIRAALATTPDSTVGINRKTGGVRFDWNLGENWKLYASYANQNRQGSRPFGMVFGGSDGGGNIDITESIDYNTHDILTGLQYSDPQSSFNLQLSASLFRNGIDTMSVQNPLTIATFGVFGVSPNTFTAGRFDLYPDNDYYKVKAEYGRSLPSLWNGRLTASIAWARSTQNDNLIAPTTFPLTGGTINGVPTTNVWNTTAALTQPTADAQIDSTLANVRLVVNPTPELALTGNIRYYETDNSTAYTACNPLTGQWGRLLNDGSGAAIVNTPEYLAAQCNLAAVQALNVAPDAGNINIRSVPYDERQIVYSLDRRLPRESEVESHRNLRAGEPRAFEPRARQDVGVPGSSSATRTADSPTPSCCSPTNTTPAAAATTCQTRTRRSTAQRSGPSRRPSARTWPTGSRRTARCASTTSPTATRTSSRRDSTGPGSRHSTPGSRCSTTASAIRIRRTDATARTSKPRSA